SAIQRSIAAAMQAEEQARAQPKQQDDRRFLSAPKSSQDSTRSEPIKGPTFSASKNETQRNESLRPPVMVSFANSPWTLVMSSGILMVSATVLILWVVSPWQKPDTSSLDSTSASAPKDPKKARKEEDMALAARASRHAQLKQYGEAYMEYGLLIDH